MFLPCSKGQKIQSALYGLKMTIHYIEKGFVPFVSLSSVCEHVHFCKICISAHIYDLTDCLLRED